jgi:predicted small secreted protein
MKRIASISFVVCSLVVSACATHTGAVTPVKVTVSSDTANKRFVSDVRNATLQVIASQVPDARPMTVAVKLDVTSQMKQAPFFLSGGGTNQQRILPTAGLDASKQAQQGALPTVPVYNSAFQTQTTEEITELRVSYTIKDAAGHVVESNQFQLDPRFRQVNTMVVTPIKGFADTDPFSTRRILATDAASFLASRVKALSR